MQGGLGARAVTLLLKRAAEMQYLPPYQLSQSPQSCKGGNLCLFGALLKIETNTPALSHLALRRCTAIKPCSLLKPPPAGPHSIFFPLI